MRYRDDRARRINALVMMCSQYDGSGDFAYRVGMPGKVPCRRRHTVDRAGQSVHRRLVAQPQRQWQFSGRRGLEKLAQRTGWSVFGS
jgi:glutaminase